VVNLLTLGAIVAGIIERPIAYVVIAPAIAASSF
jgi:hypothetical protein